MRTKVYAALKLVAVLTIIASGFAFASEMAPWTLFNSNGGVAVGFDANGTLIEPAIGQNNGTITGTAAATYTVTFNTPEPNTTYRVLLQPTGTNTTTNAALFLTTKNTTSFVVTPASVAGFSSGTNIDWFKFRN